jgi:hypothetical protein
MNHSGYRTVIGCRATQASIKQTFALLRHWSSIDPCRRAAGRQVREVAYTWIVVPTPELYWPDTQAGVFGTSLSPEKRLKRGQECWVNCGECCRKACFTSVMERNNAWLQELIGRLSMTRMPLVLQLPSLLNVQCEERRRPRRSRALALLSLDDEVID